MADGLPAWVDDLEVAMAFGVMPEDLADPETGISELWFERARYYVWTKTLWQMGLKTGKQKSAAPKPEELGPNGEWFLTG